MQPLLETVRMVGWPHFTSPLINFPRAAASLTVGNKKLESIHGAPHNHHPWCTTQPRVRHHTTHSHYTMIDNMLHTSTLYCTPCHTTPLALDTLPPVHTYIDGAHIKTTQPNFYRATYNLAMIVHRRLPQVTTKPRSPLH